MHRKLAVAAAVMIVGVAAAAYWFVAGRDPHPGLLAHVPADTVLFAGRTDPGLPWTETFNMWGPIGAVGNAGKNTTDPAEARRVGGEAAGFLAGLYRQTLKSLAEDEHILARFGIGRDHVAAAYNVGALPVLRVSLDNASQFWQRVDAIEAAAGIERGSEADTSERRYTFETGSGDARLELLVATRSGHAVMTLTGSGISEEALAIALGEALPETSLQESGRLDELARRHDTLASAMGFIDHQRLVAGLTGDKDSRLARMLSELAAAHTGDSQFAGPFTQDACRRDARAIAALWPYTAFGVTRLDTNTREMGSRIVAAVADDALLERVRGLRGHVPEPVAEQPVYGLGVGLDARNITATLKNLTSAFTQADFQCPTLQRAQQQVRQQPVGQLGLVTAMVRDIRGIAVAVQAVGSGWSTNEPIGADAVIEVATTDPEGLWQFAQSSLGLPSQPRPEAGGEPVAVPLDRAWLADLKVAIRDNALLALVGDAALDDAAGEADLEPNGIMRLRYDYGRAMQAMDRAMPGHILDGSVADDSAFDAFDLYYDSRLDISDTGIQLDIELAPAPQR